MKYIKSFLNHKKISEPLYKKMTIGEWMEFKSHKREKITDNDIKKIKYFVSKIELPCKHGNRCPSCPDPKILISKSTSDKSEIIEISRSKNIRYEIRKFYDDWYTFNKVQYKDSGHVQNWYIPIKCDTLEGIDQYLKKLSKS